MTLPIRLTNMLEPQEIDLPINAPKPNFNFIATFFPSDLTLHHRRLQCNNDDKFSLTVILVEQLVRCFMQ